MMTRIKHVLVNWLVLFISPILVLPLMLLGFYLDRQGAKKLFIKGDKYLWH